MIMISGVPSFDRTKLDINVKRPEFWDRTTLSIKNDTLHKYGFYAYCAKTWLGEHCDFRNFHFMVYFV